jgi:pyruvate ferredoxin oxidoreductase alpha subunit
MTRLALDGDAAIAEGVRLSRPRFVAAYPITPQTPIVERVADFIAVGRLDARYMATESEHSALTAVVGSAVVGVRTFTATAGAGLALMHEIVGVASGNRLPILMAIANRALPSPWSLQTDHSDSMAERDMGWIQLYAENCQEALDLVIVGYRVAESVRLPVMLCIDGFFLSHATEGVEVPEQEAVDAFLPPYVRGSNHLDPEHPMTLNQLTSADMFTELKYCHKLALDRTIEEFPVIGAAFGVSFGRPYSLVEAEATEGADLVLVTLGSCSGTAKHVARALRAQGKKVGTLKVTAFRPFPRQAIRDTLAGAKAVAVIDRSWGLGSDGALALDVKAALYGAPNIPVYDFIAGLGGRDLHAGTISACVDRALAMAADGTTQDGPEWIDLRKEVPHE